MLERVVEELILTIKEFRKIISQELKVYIKLEILGVLNGLMSMVKRNGRVFQSLNMEKMSSEWRVNVENTNRLRQKNL